MKIIKYFVFLLSLNLLVGSVCAHEFSDERSSKEPSAQESSAKEISEEGLSAEELKELIVSALKNEDFSDKSQRDIITIADRRLMPVLEKHLIREILDTWALREILDPGALETKSLNPLTIEIPNSTHPEAEAIVIGSKTLIVYHLKEVIGYCDDFFRENYKKIDDKTRLGIMIDLHDLLLKHLEPKVEERFTSFWEVAHWTR